MKRKTKTAVTQFVSPEIGERVLLEALAAHWNSTKANSGGRTAMELAQASKLHVLTVRAQLKHLLACGKARVGFEVRTGIDTYKRRVPVYFFVK